MYFMIANLTWEKRMISQWQHGYKESEAFTTELLYRDQIPMVQLFLAESH